MRHTSAAIAVACLLLGCGPGAERAAAAPVAPPAPLGAGPVGYGRATTGGCGEIRCVCEVTTLADDPDVRTPGTLRYCAEDKASRWVVFAARGTIHLQKTILVASDKTIDGRKRQPQDGPVVITGPARGLLRITDVRNVIITDLFFEKGRSADETRSSDSCENAALPKDTIGCGVPIGIDGDVTNVWINHNDFNHCGEKCLTVWTKLHPGPDTGKVTGGDLITISDNVFRNSFFGVLIGASNHLQAGWYPDQMRVTLYGNVFFNIFRRSPRAASLTKVHAFNNVIKYWGRTNGDCAGAFGPSAVSEGQLVLEDNVLIARPGSGNCRAAVNIEAAPTIGRGMGEVRARSNRSENSAEITESGAGQVFDPSDRSRAETYYPYRPLPADSRLEATVEADAGPRAFPKPDYR
jgi:pectate lyase